MSHEKLERMANQIAGFYLTQPEAERVAAVTKHLRDFWEPRMKQELFAMVDEGGAGLQPLVLAAAARLRAA
jgi:formate dehydrogenase subunit delta